LAPLKIRLDLLLDKTISAVYAPMKDSTFHVLGLLAVELLSPIEGKALGYLCGPRLGECFDLLRLVGGRLVVACND
jgi:hypothetical protein